MILGTSLFHTTCFLNKNKVLVVRLKTSKNAARFPHRGGLRLAVVPNPTYVSLRARGMSSKVKMGKRSFRAKKKTDTNNQNIRTLKPPRDAKNTFVSKNLAVHLQERKAD